MTRFTFEEINLICCYKADTKAATVASMTAALPFMESEFTELAVILSILVYTLFSRMFDLTQPPVVKHSIAVA